MAITTIFFLLRKPAACVLYEWWLWREIREEWVQISAFFPLSCKVYLFCRDITMSKSASNSTVWKCKNFTTTQILREIKGNFMGSKLQFWPLWRPWIMIFEQIPHLEVSEIPKFRDFEPITVKKVQNGSFWNPKIAKFVFTYRRGQANLKSYSTERL